MADQEPAVSSVYFVREFSDGLEDVSTQELQLRVCAHVVFALLLRELEPSCQAAERLGHVRRVVAVLELLQQEAQENALLLVDNRRNDQDLVRDVVIHDVKRV